MTRSGRVAAERRWRLRHLIGAVVVIAVICFGGLGYVVYRQNQDDKAPTEAAEKFLNALQTNSPSDAYLQLCAATKKQYSPSAFAAYVSSQPRIESHRAVAVEVSKVDGVRSAVVTEDVKNDSGSGQSRSIVLANEGGDWLVCGQPY